MYSPSLKLINNEYIFNLKPIFQLQMKLSFSLYISVKSFNYEKYFRRNRVFNIFSWFKF